MKAITKEFISMTILLVIVFLILTHYTGFSRSVGALGSNYAKVIKTFQGRA
jgi:hypothetical protein